MDDGRSARSAPSPTKSHFHHPPAYSHHGHVGGRMPTPPQSSSSSSTASTKQLASSGGGAGNSVNSPVPVLQRRRSSSNSVTRGDLRMSTFARVERAHTGSAGGGEASRSHGLPYPQPPGAFDREAEPRRAETREYGEYEETGREERPAAPPSQSLPPPPLAPYVRPEQRFFAPSHHGHHYPHLPSSISSTPSSSSSSATHRPSIPPPQRPPPSYAAPLPSNMSSPPDRSRDHHHHHNAYQTHRHHQPPPSPPASRGQGQHQHPHWAQPTTHPPHAMPDMHRAHSSASGYSGFSAPSAQLSRSGSGGSSGEEQRMLPPPGLGPRSMSAGDVLHRGGSEHSHDLATSPNRGGTGGSSGGMGGERKAKRSRVLMTHMQQTRLSAVWKRTKFPLTQEREELAEAVGLTPRQVQVWFQNRRQNHRKQLLQNNVPEDADPRDYDDLQQSPRSRRLSLERLNEDRISHWTASSGSTSHSSGSYALARDPAGQPAGGIAEPTIVDPRDYTAAEFRGQGYDPERRSTGSSSIVAARPLSPARLSPTKRAFSAVELNSPTYPHAHPRPPIPDRQLSSSSSYGDTAAPRAPFATERHGSRSPRPGPEPMTFPSQAPISPPPTGNARPSPPPPAPRPETPVSRPSSDVQRVRHSSSMDDLAARSASHFAASSALPPSLAALVIPAPASGRDTLPTLGSVGNSPPGLKRSHGAGGLEMARRPSRERSLSERDVRARRGEGVRWDPGVDRREVEGEDVLPSLREVLRSEEGGQRR